MADVIERFMWLLSPVLVVAFILSFLVLDDRKADAKAIGWHGQRWLDE